jgi:hypothetical protein
MTKFGDANDSYSKIKDKLMPVKKITALKDAVIDGLYSNSERNILSAIKIKEELITKFKKKKKKCVGLLKSRVKKLPKEE